MHYDTLSDVTRERILEAKSLDAARFVLARYFSAATGTPLLHAFRERWPTAPSLAAIEDHCEKGAVPATTGVLLPSDLSRPILAAADATGIVGRIGGVRVPFNYPIPVETSRLTGDFVTTGRAKPLRASAFTPVTLAVGKVVSATVCSEDLLKFGGPAAETFIRSRLTAGVVRGADVAFTDPAHAHAIVAGVPATAGGSALDTDLAALLADYVSRGGAVESAVLILSSANAIGAALNGNLAFETLTATGGTAAGIRTLASDAVGASVILLDASQTLIADDGDLVVDVSTSGAIEMTDTPIGDGGSPATATQLVSLFQNNYVALKAERFINWALSNGGAAYIASADYLS